MGAVVSMGAGAAIALLVYFTIRWAQCHTAKTAPTPARADCIVVLGAAVWLGGRPSGVLAGRLARAAALHRAGVAPLVVCTGGIGRHPPSEADVGRRFLVERGVPDSAIVVEDRSRTTAEQAGLVARALATRGLSSAVLVTSSFHAPRALLLFRRAGLTVTDGSVDHPGLRRRARLSAREAAALAVLQWWVWLGTGCVAGLLAAARG